MPVLSQPEPIEGTDEDMQTELSTAELLDELSSRIEQHVQKMKRVSATKLGMDERVGSVWVDGEYVVDTKEHDKILQYYGGYEYVEKEYRTEAGGYVFYSREAGRVWDGLGELAATEMAEKHKPGDEHDGNQN